MGESTVRDVIEIMLGGKTYPFPRPVIARRREFHKAALRLAEFWEQFDFLPNHEGAAIGTPKQSAKNTRLFMELTERILDTLAEFCPSIRADLRGLREKFNGGEITDEEIGAEWGKLKEFVSSPFDRSRGSAPPDDTSSNG